MSSLSIKIILALAIPALLGLRANAQDWPKSITTPSGAVINLYQPQVLSYSGDIVKSRSVISVKEAGART